MSETPEKVICRCEICRKEFAVDKASLAGLAGTLASEFAFDGGMMLPKTGQIISIELMFSARLKSGDMCKQCGLDMMKNFCDIFLKNSQASA